jgi:hypothetical protein
MTAVTEIIMRGPARATATSLLAAPARRPASRTAVQHWWTDPHVWRLIVESAAVVVASALLAALLVRWVLPPVLRAVIAPVQDAISALATLVVLPEYLVTTVLRHADRKPPRLAYDYSAAVTGVARYGRTAAGLLLGGVSRGAAKAHPLLVAVGFGALALAQVLN